MIEQTLAIIKPDAVKNNFIGDICHRIEHIGLTIVTIKMLQLTIDDAKSFYYVHKEQSFYYDLTKFMSSAPVVVMVLEGDDAIAKYRRLMGSTNPQDADKGTIRADLASSIDANAVHGSDSIESARYEISYFFSKMELLGK